MDLRGTWLESLFGVQNKIKRFILDLDQLESFFGEVTTGGSHRRHGITHESNGIVEKISLVDAITTGPNQAAVLMSQDGFHPGSGQSLGEIYLQDSGMGVGTSQNTGIEHSGKLNIGAVGGPPGNPLQTIDSRSRLSDGFEFFSHGWAPFRRGP